MSEPFRIVVYVETAEVLPDGKRRTLVINRDTAKRIDPKTKPRQLAERTVPAEQAEDVARELAGEAVRAALKKTRKVIK
jgi:hypothetical protein